MIEAFVSYELPLIQANEALPEMEQTCERLLRVSAASGDSIELSIMSYAKEESGMCLCPGAARLLAKALQAAADLVEACSGSEPEE